jgi:hypothetical protein
MRYSKYVKDLVKFRLMTMPPNIKISINGLGEFTKDELIEEIEKLTPAGKAAIRMELLFIRKTPSLPRNVFPI